MSARGGESRFAAHYLAFSLRLILARVEGAEFPENRENNREFFNFTGAGMNLCEQNLCFIL